MQNTNDKRYLDRVRSAVLEALSALLEVAPKLVKAFVPQLQATFAKALRDPVSAADVIIVEGWDG